MSANVLITGASGYLGGSLVAALQKAELPAHGTIFALVRKEEQAVAVKEAGLSPLQFDTSDAAAVEKAVLDNNISVVFWLIDALQSYAQLYFIRALAKLKAATGTEVHFLHTSGAKVFSSHAAAPDEKPWYDNQPDVYDIHKKQASQISIAIKAVETNNIIVETAEELGVRSYVFVPCIVYGEGRGFGNRISIQTVAVIKAARALRKVYRVHEGRPMWPVSHIDDNTSLYRTILEKILKGEDPGHGKHGYFLASSGHIAWDDFYSKVAEALHKRGLVDEPGVFAADDKAIEGMAKALDSPVIAVSLQLSGSCTFTAAHGRDIGWEPKYGPEHILEATESEVELVLKHS